MVFTALSGYLVSPGAVHPFLGFVGILAIALGTGAAGCLNHWYEFKTDALMERTKNRPIANGVINPDDALSFGVILAVGSVILLEIAQGFLPSVLLAFSILFYVFFYTIYLKPRTWQSIVWGGAAGARPPVIGYSFSGNIDLYAWSLFLIIFLWTPSHFWVLAMGLKKDYASAGIPTLPNIKGDEVTRKQIFWYAVASGISSFIPLFMKQSHYVLWVCFIVLNAFWIIKSFMFMVKKEENSKKLFIFSIFYLFFIFLLLSIFH